MAPETTDLTPTDDSNPASAHTLSHNTPFTIAMSAHTAIPEPAFIGEAAAALIVATDYDIRLEQHGIEPSGETVLVMPSALRLINQFLDQLLYDVLSRSRSLSLFALRPAVNEVLKPKLARSAIHSADLEIREYLRGGEDEDSTMLPDHHELDSDLSLDIWKQTRLQCMAYSSLGQMEEKDAYLSDEGSRVVSSVVAIFLVSMLEFIGEQALIVAGTAAHQRLQSKHIDLSEIEVKSCRSVPERLVVEVEDMESIALDRTLGGSWRKWKLRDPLPTTSVPNRHSVPRGMTQLLLTGGDIVSTLVGPLLDTRFAYLDLASGISTSKQTDTTLQSYIQHQVSPHSAKSIECLEKEWSLVPSLTSTCLPCMMAEIQSSRPGVTRKRSYSAPQLHHIRICETYCLLQDSSKRESKIEGNACHESESTSDADPTDMAKDESLPMKGETNKHSTSPDKIPIKTKIISHHADDQVNSMKGPEYFSPVGSVHKEMSSASPINCDSQSETRTELSRPMASGPSLVDSQIVSDTAQLNSSDSIRSAENFHGDDFARSRPGSLKVMQPSPKLSAQSRPYSFHLLAANSSPAFRPTCKSHPTWPASNTRQTTNYYETFPTSQCVGTNTNEQHTESDVLSDKERTINGDKAASSEDGRISPSAAAFAAAVQGIDAYYFDPNFVSSNVKQDKKRYQNLKHQTKLYTNSFVDDMGRDSPVSGTLANVSPVSLPENESVYIGRCSPTSTVSSMEKTIDEENFTFTNRKCFQVNQQNFREEIHENVSADHEPKRATHTSDSASSSISHRLRVVRTSEEGAMRNFDQLIESDQTIQYTLTMQNVRVTKGSDYFQVPTETECEPHPAVIRSISNPIAKDVSTQPNALKSSLDNVKLARLFPPISQTDLVTGPRKRPQAPQPRDARVDQESISELAEILRNTGPVHAPTNQATGIKTIKKSRLSSASAPNKRTRARTKLQSRDPVAQRDECISDLIDFVRSGPQLNNCSRRISLSVAPFHNNVEDEIVVPVSSSSHDNSLPEPRYYQTSPSINSSVTSQSALLVNSLRNKNYLSLNERNPDQVILKCEPSTRKKIEPDSFDMSEDDDYDFPPRSKLIQEESLLDFLKYSSPPDDLTGPSDKNSPGKATRNVSSSVLFSIFGRNFACSPLPPKSANRPTPPHISIKSDSGLTNILDSNKFKRSSQIAHLQTTCTTRVHQTTYVPREAISTLRTRELAEFLIINDPPTTTDNEPRPFYLSPKKGESRSLQKIFSWKKPV